MRGLKMDGKEGNNAYRTNVAPRLRLGIFYLNVLSKLQAKIPNSIPLRIAYYFTNLVKVNTYLFVLTLFFFYLTFQSIVNTSLIASTCLSFFCVMQKHLIDKGDFMGFYWINSIKYNIDSCWGRPRRYQRMRNGQ